MREPTQLQSDQAHGDERRSEPADRRTLLTSLAALGAGALGFLVPAGSALVAVLDSLRPRPKPRAFRATESGAGQKVDFVRIGHVDAVPADGQPRRFTVLIDQVDAWNFTPNYPAGAVYIRRTSETGPLQVLHATCPHAGCSVAPSADGQAFHCPCHNSAFDLEGKRVTKAGKENPSPRDMDPLEVDAERLAQGEIWIRFQDFQTGQHERKPKL